MPREALPLFLKALSDCNFYLLTPFSAVPVRLAAIDLAQTNWRAAARFEPVHRTRILDLNVDDSAISEGAEQILFGGTTMDTIDFVDGAIILAKKGSPESHIAVKLHLSPDDLGRYGECDLPEMGEYTSEKIEIAIDDLDGGDALQWQSIILDR